MIDGDDFSEAAITLLPPGDRHNCDEESGDKDGFDFDNLPCKKNGRVHAKHRTQQKLNASIINELNLFRSKIISKADLKINFGSHKIVLLKRSSTN